MEGEDCQGQPAQLLNPVVEQVTVNTLPGFEHLENRNNVLCISMSLE